MRILSSVGPMFLSWLREQLPQYALLPWLLVLFMLMWLVYMPLTYSAQTTLTVSLVVILFLIMLGINRLENERTEDLIRFLRLLAIVIAAFVSLRYLSWRINYTISYHDFFSLLGAILLLAAEIYTLFIFVIGGFVNAWPIQRQPPKLPNDPEQLPLVDILVPSYNESPELLELTLLAATQLDYPRHRYRVYLCDDGATVQRRNRPDIADAAWERYDELQALCQRVGARYVTRERNEHAKAGNLNAALRHCQGDLVLVLDADHIPTANILRNTVGFFLQDPKLFLVQTPHFFINPDPLERNLDTYGKMPSENEMFYGMIQPGLDFWNASFFCGSAALLRRRYLNEIGGIAGESITEDAETAMSLHGLGYNSVYLNQPMITGLQPETFTGFIVQRSRWAQGMTQILLLKNPWVQPKMTISQRLAYTSSISFWLFPFARLIFFIAPALYLLFSLKILDAFLPVSLLAYALPHVIGVLILGNILYGRTRWPLISELYETIQSMQALPAIINVLRAPRSPSFSVTPKGERLDREFISQLALPFYLLFLLNVVCLIAGVIRLSLMPGPEDITIIVLTMILTAINLVFSLAAIGVMLEKPQKRAAYRIPTHTTDLSGLLHDGRQGHPVKIFDLSHGGAGLEMPHPLPPQHDWLLRIKIPAMHQWRDIPVRLTRSWQTTEQHYQAGVLFKPQTLADQRAIVALVYGDNTAQVANQKRRQRRIGLTQGAAFLLSIAFKHAIANFAFLSHIFARRFRAWLRLKLRMVTSPTQDLSS